MPIVILAHGLLGGYDEVVFVGVAIVFVAMMAFSWFRSQQLPDDELDYDKLDEEMTPHPSDVSEVERFELD